jgi:hypothetical protein
VSGFSNCLGRKVHAYRLNVTTTFLYENVPNNPVNSPSCSVETFLIRICTTIAPCPLLPPPDE